MKHTVLTCISAVFRVRHPQPAVGVCHLRHLDLSGVQRTAPRPRRPPLLRALRHHGQVEGLGAQQDEGDISCKHYRVTMVVSDYIFLTPFLKYHNVT